MDPNAQPHGPAAGVPPPRRNRTPRGPVPPAYPSPSPNPNPPLLKLAAPYHTRSREDNLFVPDAQMLFHVLGECDQMMNSTFSFLRSSPAWLPIVSQLYISVLWNAMILQVSGGGQLDNDFVQYLGINECMIPGPLVPFFQSLAAVNGPFNSIRAIMPDLDILWHSEKFHPNPDYARQIPIPAIILDQLHYFSQWPIPENQTSAYTNFEWYRNVFCQGVGTYNPHNRIGPQLCGSLFTTQSQFDTAHEFWSSNLASGITRTNANATNRGFKNLTQLFGFQSQSGTTQLHWFKTIAFVMRNYARHFRESAPLGSVLSDGIRAAAMRGVPDANAATRDWFYPRLSAIEPFSSSRFPARREIPDEMAVVFQHAEYRGLEEIDEQCAITVHTNIQWASTMIAQNGWTGIDGNRLHQGKYWSLRSHRFTSPVRLKYKFSTIIASRYHQEDDDSD